MDQHPANDPARDYQDRLPSDPPGPVPPAEPGAHRPEPARFIPGHVPAPASESASEGLVDGTESGDDPASTGQPHEPEWHDGEPATHTPEPRGQYEAPAPAREETTTHASFGAGNPRLLVTSELGRIVHELTEDRLVIGSGPGAGLRLNGLDAEHAIVVHDERDEYVVTLLGAGLTNTAPGPGDEEGALTPNLPQVLRTGANFLAGDWRFVFMREEYADHGRPYGGREGGEYEHQGSQGEQPHYSEGAPEQGHRPEAAETP